MPEVRPGTIIRLTRTRTLPDMTTSTLLRIDASARRDGSSSRALVTRLVDGLVEAGTAGDVLRRDLADGVELLDEAWIGANVTPDAERTAGHLERLSGSDALVAELVRADTVVIGMPIYNFGPPAALKAWIDLIARARRTFRYSESGPVGLLENKRAYVVVTSGGTAVDSAIDFATPYLRHALGFVGIDDVTVIAADRQMANPDAVAAARSRIDALVAEARAGLAGRAA